MSVNSYLIQDISAAANPVRPDLEAGFWYFFYFGAERGGRGLTINRRDIANTLTSSSILTDTDSASHPDTRRTTISKDGSPTSSPSQFPLSPWTAKQMGTSPSRESDCENGDRASGIERVLARVA